MIPLNLEEEESTTYANILECQVGTLPITYLGVPLEKTYR